MEDADVQNDLLFEEGTVIDGFEILRQIGCGAMAVVYLARRQASGERVAMKVLNSSHMNHEEFVGRFKNEAYAAGVLQHPNVIRAISTGVTPQGLPYFCMEYVEGESLQDLIRRIGRIPVEQALMLGWEISDALEYGWNNFRFTHGDIKPENIMVTVDGHAKLADFGLSRVEGHEYEGKEIVLTPLYAAPELISGTATEVSCLGDIYAFGSTLFHAVAGEPPFPGESAQEIMDRQVHEIPEPLILRCPNVSPELSDLIARMLVKEPQNRIQSWTEVKAALGEIHASVVNPPKTFQDAMVIDESSSPAQHFQAKEHPKPKKSLLGVLLAILLVVACAGGVSYLVSKLMATPQGTSAPQSETAGAVEPDSSTQEVAGESSDSASAQESVPKEPASTPETAPASAPETTPASAPENAPASAPETAPTPPVAEAAPEENTPVAEESAPEKPSTEKNALEKLDELLSETNQEKNESPEENAEDSKKEEVKPPKKEVPKIQPVLYKKSTELQRRLEMALLADRLKGNTLKTKSVPEIRQAFASLRVQKRITQKEPLQLLLFIEARAKDLNDIPDVMLHATTGLKNFKICNAPVRTLSVEGVHFVTKGKASHFRKWSYVMKNSGDVFGKMCQRAMVELQSKNVQGELLNPLLAGILFSSGKITDDCLNPKYIKQVGAWKRINRLEEYKDLNYKGIQGAYKALEKACVARNAKEIEAKCKAILSPENQKWIPPKDRENLEKILNLIH